MQLVDLRSDTESPAEQRDREATTPVIDRLLSGDANDPCTVPGGRVVAGQANELAAEFFTQGQIALGRAPVDCSVLGTGYPSPLVRAVTVRGASPDQALAVTSGASPLAEGAGFVTWVRSVGGDAPSGPSVSAGAVDGADVAGLLRRSLGGRGGGGLAAHRSRCLVDRPSRGPCSAGPPATPDPAPGWDPTPSPWRRPSTVGPRTSPGSRRTAPGRSSSRGRRGSATDGASTGGGDPIVVVTASAAGFGVLATTSSDLEAGATLAPPRVVWSGPTVLEGDGTVGGRVGVVPAPLPAGAAIPDGVVCIAFGAATSTAGTAQLVPAQERSCHPAGEAFEVNASVTVVGDQNDTVLVVLPYTVTHRRAGAADELVVSTGEAELPPFELTKPADVLQSALLTAGIVGVSTLLPLALLLLLLNLQRRLPDPASRQMARIPLVVDRGELRRPEGSRVSASDLRPVVGTRSAYQLSEGLSLVRPRTFDPFAPTVVEARSTSGNVSAVPWMAPGAGRSVQVPAGFTDLVLVRSVPGSDVGEALVILPTGATAEDADRIVDRGLAGTNRLWSRVSSAMRLVGA